METVLLRSLNLPVTAQLVGLLLLNSRGPRRPPGRRGRSLPGSGSSSPIVPACPASRARTAGFIPSRGVLLCVGPHPKFISGSLLRGFLIAFYYRLEALASVPPPHWRWQHRSRFLPDQVRHDYILNCKLRSRPPSWIYV